MPITQLNQLQIAYKKLLGKSHVSPNRTEVSELIPSFVQSANSTVFGQTLPSGSQIPTNQTANLYQTSSGGIVELVRFELTQLGDGDYTPSNGSLSGTTIDDQAENITNGAHGYALRISGSYNTRSNNPRKNTGLFTDGGSLTGSAGSLQLVPPAYDSRYAARVYQSGGTEILGSNAIEWSLDYASGVLFVQDYDASVIPAFVDAFLYIGKYTNEVVADLSASLQSVAGTNAYATMSVGGVAVIADNATGTLTIASGSFGGAATANNNLLISASAGIDTITFSLRDNLSITSMTASNGYLLTNSNNGRQYSTNGGTTASLNTLTFRDTDTTSDVTQSIGRIAFESFDTDTSGSNNSQVVRAFIEAVSEDTTPDAFLAFGTAVSGALAQERMRVTNSGVSVTGGISASGNLTVTGNSTIGGNLIVTGSTTLGDGAADTASINAGRVNISNLTAGSTELAVLVTGSGGQVFTRQLAASAFSGGSGISGTGTVDRLVLWSGSSGTTSVTNDDADLSFNRSTNELTVNSSTFGQNVSVNQNLTVGGNATITGDLTVNGETTIINTTNLSIEDKFIVLGRSSGSQAPASEGGIIIEGAAGSGSAFVFNSGGGGANGLANRWGVALGVGTASMNVTPTDFMVTVSQSSAAPSDANAPTFGSASFGFGNMHIQDNGEIWIYS